MKAEQVLQFAKRLPRINLGDGALLAGRLLGVGSFLVRLGLGGMNSLAWLLVSLGLTGVEWAITQQVYLTGLSYKEDCKIYNEKCGDAAQRRLAHKTSEDEYEKVRAARLKIDEEIAAIESELDQRQAQVFDQKETQAAAVAAVLEGYAAGIAQNRAILGR